MRSNRENSKVWQSQNQNQVAVADKRMKDSSSQDEKIISSVSEILNSNYEKSDDDDGLSDWSLKKSFPMQCSYLFFVPQNENVVGRKCRTKWFSFWFFYKYSSWISSRKKGTHICNICCSGRCDDEYFYLHDVLHLLPWKDDKRNSMLS